jgi:curved DNA-binding protein CbpA
MERMHACKILNIDVNFTPEELKQAFRENALRYHPDKTKSDSHDEFIKIREAYVFLSNDETTYSYNELLKEFLLYLKLDNCIFVQLFENLSRLTDTYSLEIFKKLDSHNAYTIYVLLSKYNGIFKINPTLLEQFREIIVKKSGQIFIIHPSLNDLYSSNVYCLEHKGEKYYVPMWHEEVYYGENIVVRCVPEVPETIYIDEKNNIHITVTKSLVDIAHLKSFVVGICERKYTIIVEQLLIKCYQLVKFNEEGIPRINTKDIYNDEKKSDVIVHLSLRLS